MEPLISTSELADRLDEVVLNDIRWALTDPERGHQTYLVGHIPTAVYVDLDTDLAARPGAGRHPLPEPKEFAKTLGRLGVMASDEVVVYDDMQNTIAARMWWMMRSIGHDRVRVLDGGYQRWVDENRQVDTGNVVRAETSYPDVNFTGVATHGDLESRPHVDARAPARYRGEFEPVDSKAGHIPGAINLPAADNVDETGRFLPESDLSERFAGLGHNTVVSCGSGVNACHNALAMTIAGLEMPDIYVGSFSEWSGLDLPVTKGRHP